MQQLASSLCEQWSSQYAELSKQWQLIYDNMSILKGLIEKNGGVVPELNPNLPGYQIISDIDFYGVNRPEDPEYKKGDSWGEKIQYVLFYRLSMLSSTVVDIAEAIHNEEPELDLKKIIKAVTMEASKMGVKGKLGFVKKGNRNYYYLNRTKK